MKVDNFNHKKWGLSLGSGLGIFLGCWFFSISFQYRITITTHLVA